MKAYTAILHEVRASYHGSSKQAVIERSRSLLQIYCLKPASLYVTPLFVWLGLTPNQVSWLGFLVGLAACLLLAWGAPAAVVLGAWLYVVHRLLDHVDGNLARYGKKTSAFGHFLDGALGVLVQMALFLAVGIGAYRQCALDPPRTPAALARHPELALIAGALISSLWMAARFIKLFHDSTFAATPATADPSHAIAPAAAAAERGKTGRVWASARAANGVVPLLRVFGLVAAAHTGTLALYLGFFALYVPAAFAAQFVKLLRSPGAASRGKSAADIGSPCSSSG